MTVATRKGDVIVDTDEQPGKGMPDKIPTLKPAFAKDGTITAATSSSISDGAAALVLTRASVAERQGLSVKARIVAHAAHAHEPAKFTTAFDALCDELLPPLQEPVAARHPWIVFAICANPDGYVPTHNLRFTQPLTGDRAVDLVGNRTKRIFADRVGRSVGAHTDPYRLQVYRRDTGQIMFDLSVPVFVDGRHWGGFRVGYTLE